jgi:hypothetical protein
MKKLSLLAALLLLAGCEEKKDQPWLGYGEGDTAYISAAAGLGHTMKIERGAWCIVAIFSSC